MRTTVDLSDDLLRRAKKRAADAGVPLREVLEAALRGYLDAPRKRSAYKLRWKPSKGRTMPGVDLDRRASLHDVMERS